MFQRGSRVRGREGSSWHYKGLEVVEGKMQHYNLARKVGKCHIVT